MPRVTVIIPTYNWSSVLPYSIASVLGQTFTDFELLVVGDGCTDDSGAVVSAIGDPRVRWINLEPRFGHQSGPNNQGLRQARGKLIAYLGQDDLWFPHHLASSVAAIDAGADLAYSIIASVPAQEGPPRLFVATAAGQWLPPSVVVHRRSVTERVGGWGDYRQLYVDPEVDLWRRVAAAGFSLVLVPRLSAVKFSAAFRRDVYRLKPCHEQAEWLRRIQSEPDLEVVELAKTVALLFSRQREAGPVRRIWRFLHPSRWVRLLTRRKGAHIKSSQRFKGVDEP
jgi:glycosyltransferase involved in cell wall biosynthesis